MGSRWTKKALEGLAIEERKGIDCDPLSRLDLKRLTDEWGIPVYNMDELSANGCSEAAVNHLTAGDGKWSAALVPLGTARFIVVNSSHTPQRHRSNIAHEMSHLLLEHEFTETLFSDGGCRNLDPSMKAQENEAVHLSGELLIPKTAAIKAALKNRSDAEVAQHFDVSIEFARMRMNASGARRIAERSRAKWR
ncbi:ImmA/IrrE family metallo-endopeptidase [Streptomyces sp. NPDC020731]|uniref:ImmA/IrrE family metallo-endopeptidase n=1 Tax=Streptomyces sp. NPDC020731 TaxID=3365085 RepID=UPI00378820CF